MTMTSFAAARQFVGPEFPDYGSGIVGATTMSATGQKMMFYGRVQFAARTGTKNLQGVGFRTGSGVTKAGGSTIGVDVQGILTSAGTPAQPDGVSIAGGGVTIANANYAASTWHSTSTTEGNFGTKPALAHGQVIAVVFSFASYGGADALAVANIAVSRERLNQGAGTYNGTVWAGSAVCPCILLEFDDGSFGTIGVGFPWTASNAPSFNNGSTPAIYGNVFTPAFKAQLIGARVLVAPAANGPFELRLYSGTTVLATATYDPRAQVTSGFATYVDLFFSAEQLLTAGTPYRLAIAPTSATSIVLQSWDVNSNAHLVTHAGIDCYHSTLNAGTWTDTNTRRLELAPLFSGFDDGTGSGAAGMLYVPNLDGI